jgi:hypothetical protein
MMCRRSRRSQDRSGSRDGVARLTHLRASRLGAFGANASGRSGDRRPLADDRVPCVQLTIRPTAGALAFTKSSHAGWPCGRFCFWWRRCRTNHPESRLFVRLRQGDDSGVGLFSRGGPLWPPEALSRGHRKPPLSNSYRRFGLCDSLGARQRRGTGDQAACSQCREPAPSKRPDYYSPIGGGVELVACVATASERLRPPPESERPLPDCQAEPACTRRRRARTRSEATTNSKTNVDTVKVTGT